MKTILICANIFIFICSTFSQNNTSIGLCGTHKVLKKLLENEDFKQKFDSDRILIKNSTNELKNQPLTRGTIYTIPVVFHVLHNNGAENISREQILDQLAILNRDYRRLNQDANNVHANFQGLPADIEIEFKLATKAPNGDCFNGITRTESELSLSDDGWSQVDAIIQGNDVYNDEWPGDQYLNFFICGEIGNGAAGYTYMPGSIGSSMYNGIWVLSEYVGSIGTSSVHSSRVLTHEVGHWLDLPHTWGYTNEPGLPENCDSDDDIADTPNTIGSDWCNLNEATCGPQANVENYMDYSYCCKMFTEGQKERMRGALNSFVDGRNNLWTAQNISATGADGNLYLCEAKFISDREDICLGESVSFTDLSFNKAISWNWTFEGGFPSTSIEQNPIIEYQNSGTYSVKLIVSDGLITDSIIMTNFINVSNQSLSLPFYEDFENINSLENNTIWKVENHQNNNGFEIIDGVAYSGNKSVILENYNEFGENNDELISSPIDLSVIEDTVTLSFKFSYCKNPDVDYEKLQVYTSSDCGISWQVKKTLSGLLLATQESFDPWTPSESSDWKLVHVTNILSSNWSENFLFKFKFTGYGGNNLYIDDINIYNGAPSTEVISQNGINENLKVHNNFNIYPNPASKEINVQFEANSVDKGEIIFYNYLGKIVKIQEVETVNGTNDFVFKNLNLASGIYSIHLNLTDSKSVKKLVVE